MLKVEYITGYLIIYIIPFVLDKMIGIRVGNDKIVTNYAI